MLSRLICKPYAVNGFSYKLRKTSNSIVNFLLTINLCPTLSLKKVGPKYNSSIRTYACLANIKFYNPKMEIKKSTPIGTPTGVFVICCLLCLPFRNRILQILQDSLLCRRNQNDPCLSWGQNNTICRF